ncbi:hypothetical protein D3C84_454730 [compost metagenome]
MSPCLKGSARCDGFSQRPTNRVIVEASGDTFLVPSPHQCSAQRRVSARFCRTCAIESGQRRPHVPDRPPQCVREFTMGGMGLPGNGLLPQLTVTMRFGGYVEILKIRLQA